MTPATRTPIIAQIIRREPPKGITYAELSALNKRKQILRQLNRVRVKAGRNSNNRSE